MGEIADQMINGSACELCLMPFEDPEKKGHIYEHGYPVVCHDCWQGLTYEDKQQYQKAEVKTIS